MEGRICGHRPAKLFERLTSEAMSCYLTGQAVVFGWPSNPHYDRIKRELQIKRKVRNLSEILGEIFVEEPRGTFKDRGLDVVGWMPFSDKEIEPNCSPYAMHSSTKLEG